MKKVSNIKSKLILSSLVLSTPFVASSFVVSCTYNIKDGDLSKDEQQALLNSDNAKKYVFDTWLTSTYTTLYSQTHFNNNEDQRKEFEYFITYLKWPETNNIDANKRTEIENEIYDAYKFYVTYRSSISTGDSSNSDSSSNVISSNTNTYFVKKANEWKKESYTTIDGESLINLKPNIGVLETKADWKQDTNFKLMFKAHGTEIYANVLKILIAQMYFLNANETLIKNGTDYNKQVQKSYSLEYYRATSFDIKDRFYNLNKYLVDKNPQFKWSLSNDTSGINNIKNYNDFNNLMGSVARTINTMITPSSYDKFDADSDKSLSLLRGFTSLELNSTTTDGDLSNDVDAIKLFGYQKSGLLSNNNKLLYSFDNLNTRNKINELVTRNPNPLSLGLPKVIIKDSSLKKNIQEISLSDFEISFNNLRADGNTILEAQDASKQKWQIIKLAFMPQNNNSKESKKVNLSMKYTFEDSGKTYEYLYNFDVVWDDSKVQSNIFQKGEYWFTPTSEEFANLFPTYINSQIDGKTNFSYILRPLPLFEQTGETTRINQTIYMKGKFSLENTVWSSLMDPNGVSQNNDAPKKNLVNWLILNDATLWTSIQDFYLFNNYDLESDNSTVSSIISQLGLTKKTNADRRAAGILY